MEFRRQVDQSNERQGTARYHKCELKQTKTGSWIDIVFFVFKQKTAYELRISDWSSDVCSSDLLLDCGGGARAGAGGRQLPRRRAGARGRSAEPARNDQIGRASCRERVCQYE